MAAADVVIVLRYKTPRPLVRSRLRPGEQRLRLRHVMQSLHAVTSSFLCFSKKLLNFRLLRPTSLSSRSHHESCKERVMADF